jgi:hypothetical protein
MQPIRTAIAAMMILCAGTGVAQAQGADGSRHDTLLQIEAEGTVEAKPDMMMVEASVVTTGSTAAEALDLNTELAGRLIEAVRKSGIRIKELQTSRLSVRARFADDRRRDDNRPPTILGYVAENALSVELADVAQAGHLVSLMFEAGANEIRGPWFQLRDPVPVQREAVRVAIRNATAEAENYAQALGMKVSRVLRVFEREFRDEESDAIIVTGSRVRPTPIEPGEVEITATIHIEFLLEPK